jgi:hypothetical protein
MEEIGFQAFKERDFERGGSCQVFIGDCVALSFDQSLLIAAVGMIMRKTCEEIRLKKRALGPELGGPRQLGH